MARSTRARRHAARLLRPTPYPIPSYRWKARNDAHMNRGPLASQKRDWEDATCSVCMEYPHNAVLLLCSSHDKGCRPYMCGTSYRHSNCLDQFKNAYTRVASLEESPASSPNPTLDPSSLAASEKTEIIELACPLCRGKVKGWTVVEPARSYLNGKRRTCMQDGCSFIGTYKELCKHVKSDHPLAKPREVDPALEQKWRRLEHERERQDVISTITASMPRSFVIGDYVIDLNSDAESESEDEVGHGFADSRRILYLIMREGARHLRFQSSASESAEDDYAYSPAVSSGADGASAYPLEGGDEDDMLMLRGRGTGVLTPERGRRRRRRSRGRLFFGAS